MSEGLAGLPPVVEATCKGVPGANGTSGTPKVSVDLLVSAGVGAGIAGLELAEVLCTGTPEICGLATAVGPAEAEVAGKGLSGEASVGVGEDAIGIIMPVTIDATWIGAAGLLLQDGVLKHLPQVICMAARHKTSSVTAAVAAAAAAAAAAADLTVSLR